MGMQPLHGTWLIPNGYFVFATMIVIDDSLVMSLVEEIPGGFPFEIQDEKGMNTVTLKRNYHGERVGGRDTVLVDALSRRIPLVSDRPTIIFGADVTHSHPREDSSPSIVVVNASKAYFCHEGRSRIAWFTIELQVTCEMGS
ncbi:hypothetical protein ZIOFF_071241 [Zingiber officinale]|uniref:Piwi domain-containing protein n=1 Tax=Zingiber officinale TaxID=94328 RepID=A0A8J5C817_ZINOF|nr:hypothetical protein ZIOFF_071241 [Zingiber officinale]